MKNYIKPTICILILLGLTACVTTQEQDSSMVETSVFNETMDLLKTPMPVKTIEIYDQATQQRVKKDVLSLESAEIRKRLTSTSTFISIEKKDSSGKFSYVGSWGKVSKGTYKVTFDYANYMNAYIDHDNGSTAIGCIAVGLRVIATLQTTSKSLDVSGLLPIGLAAKDNKVFGQIEYYVYGMSNDKISIAAPSPKTLDLSSIQEVIEASAKTKVMFNLDETSLEPYLIRLTRSAIKDVKKINGAMLYSSSK